MSRLSGSIALFAFLAGASLHAQDGEASARRYFIGSSGFMLFNALPDPPDFYQLNAGYWLTDRDVVSIEAITWKYRAPLGIPYGTSKDSPDERYPGYVREYGIGAAYQRFHWNGLYTGFHVLPLLQHFVDTQGAKVQNGFQLFLTARVGYHVTFLQDRFFIEPSMAFTHWPVRSSAPPAFADKDRKWPNYFLFEPGFHIGVKF